MYDTQEEARQKLEGSVVLLNGQPVYVVSSGGSKGKVFLKFQFLPLPRDGSSPKTETLPITDPGWDFKSMASKLGYMNYDDGRSFRDIVFLSRITTRHSRQGLDSRTVQLRALPECKMGLDWSYLLNCQGLVDTLNNKFVPVYDAFKELTLKPKEVPSIAISRKIALVYDRVLPPALVYRNERIGYTEDGTNFKLASHKAFLKEELVDMEGLKIA